MFKKIKTILNARKDPKAAKAVAVQMIKDGTTDQTDGILAKASLFFWIVLFFIAGLFLTAVYCGFKFNGAFYLAAVPWAVIGLIVNKLRLITKSNLLSAQSKIQSVVTTLLEKTETDPSDNNS